MPRDLSENLQLSQSFFTFSIISFRFSLDKKNIIYIINYYLMNTLNTKNININKNKIIKPKKQKKQNKDTSYENESNKESHPPDNSGESIFSLNNHKNKLSSAFCESIKINKLFYMSLLACFYMLKQSSPSTTSYITLAFSYVFIMVLGHIWHRISHDINFLKFYNIYKKKNINSLVDVCFVKFCNFLDFHSITHHDTAINKQPANIAYEFINNIFMQGGALILFIKLINYVIDTRVVILWALMYATTHNINYIFLKPSVHRDHHINNNTNFGIDIADILFDTKYDLSDIEDHNHISINLILITIIIIYFTTGWSD